MKKMLLLQLAAAACGSASLLLIGFRRGFGLDEICWLKKIACS